jgi:uncharacterized membrane protein YphA (DoxX/SURF4 family)
MKILRTLCRILIGLVFLYSGFVKGIDPIGSAYKFHDYFAAFNMDYFQFLDMPLSILLSSAEFLIGAAIILGIRMKIASWALLIFMSFFTILTFILAVFNPVSDCGCFGDALKLTNWQTFDKNIILMGLTLIIFFNRNRYEVRSKVLEEWLMLAIILAGFLFVMNYCLNHLPLIDFRPYKAGTDIVKDMSTPPGSPQDSIKSVLYYKKDGKIKEIVMLKQNTPWPDTSWKWVETKNVIIKEGYKPPIHDFSIKTFEGNDITSEVLSDQNFSFLLVAKDIKAANRKAFDRANAIAKYCKTGHCKFYALTSSSSIEAANLKNSKALVFDFYVTDGTTLKTINRANPGMLLIRNGIVLAQWHYNDFPTPSDLGDNLMAYAVSLSSANNRHLTGWLAAFIILCALLVFRTYQLRTRK